MAEPPASTPTAQSAGHLSIGEVLALLLEEFPDVTISKIRFLESQGLIDPERTSSGYRKFYADDVELLRCILREQRENYLPLKVIKDRIDSGEIDPTNENPRPRGIKNVSDEPDVPRPSSHPSAGRERPASTPDGPLASELVTGAAALFQRTDGTPSDAAPRPAPSAEQSTATSGDADSAPPATATRAAGPDPSARAAGTGASSPAATNATVADGAVLPGLMLSSDELCAMAGITRDQLADLRSYGVVAGTSSKGEEPFDEDAVEIATIAKRFLDAGVEARHLRGWRVAADREVGLLEQLIQPLLRQRNPQARAQAIAELNELEEEGGRLRSAMMRSALRHHSTH